MSKNDEITYITLTPQDRMTLAKEALRNREMDHFRMTIGSPSAPVVAPDQRDAQTADIKRLQKIVEELEKEITSGA